MIVKLIVASVLASVLTGAVAANTDPLDFDYEVQGQTQDRPALIFNDGANTFLQPRPEQRIAASASYNEGPYVVVAGVVDRLQFEVNGRPVTAIWKRTNPMLGEPGNPNGDLPRSFTGFQGRIAIIGSYATLDTVAQTDMTLPFAEAVKTLTPPGWSGSADKSVNVMKVTHFTTAVGTNWLQALGELLASQNLFAEVDFASRHVALRGDPAKSSSVAVAANTALTMPATSAADGGVSATTLSEGAGGKTLFSLFGVTLVRDEGESKEALCMPNKPVGLRVARPTGDVVGSRWDKESGCLTFDRMDRFSVGGDAGIIDVARVTGAEYDFPDGNAAGLLRVYEDPSSTYLVFGSAPKTIHVIDDLGMDNGELRDKYYKYNGKPGRLDVVADGHQVTVLRHPAVRFFEKPHV